MLHIESLKNISLSLMSYLYVTWKYASTHYFRDGNYRKDRWKYFYEEALKNLHFRNETEKRRILDVIVA